MQIGLVGLQYSGKSTLFNILSETDSSNQNIGGEKATIEVVKVPDERLEKLTEIFHPKKVVHATIEVYDIPGLRTGDDGKLRISNAFLNEVKNNDALFYVVRQFEDESVPHPMNTVNPIADLAFLENEFLFHDMAFLENRIEKIRKEVMKTKDEKLKRELLTLKKLVIAINFDDNSIGRTTETVSEIKDLIKDENVEVIPFYAKLESELSKLDDEDKKMFMEDYGITESALSKILRSSYKALGLHSFFTVGEDENRAWTIKKNFTAQDSAGVIHTDFYNKFIRAEVVAYDEFINHGSFAKCKEAGVWRLEGKDYIVQDGDIINIRHS